MQVFDLKNLTSFPYAERDKNVLYKAEGFKVRIVELPPGGEMPTCEMASHVIFIALNGGAEVTVDKETAIIEDGQALITPPATISMKAQKGVKIVAIQITPK